MNKISRADYISALKMYDRTPNYNNHLRVGQYLINTFRERCNITRDPEIFYETNERIAKEKFMEKYVEK